MRGSGDAGRHAHQHADPTAEHTLTRTMEPVDHCLLPISMASVRKRQD